MSNLKNFSVVLFTAENRYSVVPSSWIDLSGDSVSSFWPNKKTKNAAALVKCADSLPEDDWENHLIELIKSFDSYDKAYKKSGALRKTKGLEIVDTSESEATVGRANVNPPSTFLLQTTEETAVGTTADEVISNAHGDQTYELVPQTAFAQFYSEFQAFQKVTLEKQEQLLLELADTQRLLRQALSQVQIGQGVIHTYGPLPLKSVEELWKTEATVDDRCQFQLLVEELQRCGGSTVTKTVYNTLRHLLCIDLARKIRLTDVSGKICFGPLRLANAVRVSVQHSWGTTHASDSAINEAIGKYFRNTLERKEKHGNPTTVQEEEDPEGGGTNFGVNTQ